MKDDRTITSEQRARLTRLFVEAAWAEMKAKAKRLGLQIDPVAPAEAASLLGKGGRAVADSMPDQIVLTLVYLTDEEVMVELAGAVGWCLAKIPSPEWAPS